MLTEHEIEILSAAKDANPYAFEAVVRGMAVMAPRRAKYSGQEHPYWNFVDMARRTELPMLKVFDFYRNIKRSRQHASTEQNFTDESFVDSLIDELNYTAIKAGWFVGGLTKDDVMPANTDMWAEVWPVITLDFDGVMNKYDGWKGHYAHFDKREHVDELLNSLKKRGYYVVVTTARPDSDLETVVNWLYEQGLGHNVDLVTNRKVPSVAYLDDKAITYMGDSLLNYLEQIDDFEPYWSTPTNGDGPTDEQAARLKPVKSIVGQTLYHEENHEDIQKD